MNCDKREASCVCLRDKDHEGPHVCNCGGAWTGAMFRNFHPYSFPVVEGLVKKEEADDYAAEMVEKNV